MSEPRVSIIIVGRNEGERLSRCLRSVLAMECPHEDLELIYVDSHSSDDSITRAREQHVRIVTLPPGPTTAARGRNAGYRLAKGEFLLFLDGDTVVAPDFLSHAIAFLQAHSDVAVYWGHRRELFPEHSLYNRVFDLDWLFPPGESAYCGGDAVMRKSVLDLVGSYRADLIAGEDAELCSRIRSAGYRIWHADELMTHHDLAILHFAAYWRRCYRGGHAYAEVAQRTKGSLFRRESLRNHIQIVAYFLVPLVLIAAGGWVGVWITTAVAFLLFLRTVWRNRWRDAPLSTILLYSVHAHFCQLPIWLGQLAYRRNHRRQQTPQIIEYK